MMMNKTKMLHLFKKKLYEIIYEGKQSMEYLLFYLDMNAQHQRDGDIYRKHI